MEREAIVPELAVFTLTAIGIKALELAPDKAQNLAQKLIDFHQPGFLDGQNVGNTYTRAELGSLCFQYEIDCGGDVDTILDGTEASDLVQEFWEHYFPDSAHTPRLDLLLPELIGSPEDVQKAEPLRKKQLMQLLLLRHLINEDADYRGIALSYIDAIIKRSEAVEWLETSSTRYTREWLVNAIKGIIEQAEIKRQIKEASTKPALS